VFKVFLNHAIFHILILE